MWCVQHKTGWCACADGQRPADNEVSVPTKCGCVVVLPHGIADREPTCPQCLRQVPTKTARVLAAVRAGARTTYEAAAATGLTTKDVAGALSSLLVDGLVRRTGKTVPGPNARGRSLVCYEPKPARVS